MKNIAIFTDNLKVGGIQKSVINLLKHIDYSKYNVDLYLFDEDCFYDCPRNVNVIYMKKPSIIFKFLPFNISRKILKVEVLHKKYDVSIDFDSYQVYTAIGALLCDASKKVIWIHNDIKIKLREEIKYRILYTFFKIKYNYFDAYSAVSQGALDSFMLLHGKQKGKEYVVIPNYINTIEIKNKMKEKCDLVVDKNKINVVTVGRLCHQKGIDIMLNQMNNLKNYRDDFHLYLIGDGPDKAKLMKQVKKLNLCQYVTFLGNQKNPFKYLNIMDLFYLSSRYEGQGMVILEAKSVGLDILIPKHLEKYCPPVCGVDDIISYLVNYKRKKHKNYDSLAYYNANITKNLKKLFD